MPRRAQRGFTLIEILAVVLIIALVSTLMLPALGAGEGAKLRRQGERVAGMLELARQRAVVTGKPHRLVIDLHQGGYSIEWLVTAARAEGEGAEPAEEVQTSDTEEIDLAPPLGEIPDYYPIPNRFGGVEWLDEGFFFEGVDTPEGWIEQGEVFVVFDRDGASDSAQIVISDADNRTILLDVAPLLEQVRIREEKT